MPWMSNGEYPTCKSACTILDSSQSHDKLTNGARFVENGVTIMCSSMPASAYVFRLIAQNSKWYNHLRSWIVSRWGGASKSQLQPSFVVSQPLADHADTHAHLRAKGYFELDGPPEIHSGAGADADAEKGFITKPVNMQ